jgi:hypothetical protein
MKNLSREGKSLPKKHGSARIQHDFVNLTNEMQNICNITTKKKNM